MKTREQKLAYLKEYRTVNAEKISQQKKEWYQKNIERERAKRRADYQLKKQAYIERASKWRQSNPEKMKVSRAKWRLSNPEKCRELYNNYIKKRNQSGLLRRSLFHTIYDQYDGICQECYLPIDLSIKYPNKYCFSVDHIIPVSKGGSNKLDNLQPVHFFCNSSKGNRI